LFPASTSEETARRRCDGLLRRSGFAEDGAGRKGAGLSPPDLAAAGARSLAAVKDAAAISSAARWCARRNAIERRLGSGRIAHEYTMQLLLS
jgi:hypothetical protein